MPIRQQNVLAAKWSPNGDRLGAPDLTVSDNQVFGENVFSPAIQRQRLPKDVYRKLSKTLAKGEALDTSLADSVALAMKEWALEKGATHYAHVFQPLTGLTAEKHDSFYGPTGEGTALAEFSGKELIQAEPDASSFPSGGLRSTFEARGYTAWDPTSPAFILENPNGALLCIPTAFVSWTGEALDNKIPLLRSMDALSKSAMRALRLFGNHIGRADLHHRRPRAGVLPDRRAVLLRAPRPAHHRPHAVRRQAAQGPGARRPLLRLDPRARTGLHARLRAELAKLGVPIKTRHNEVAPSQYELAPIYENSNVGSDHQQLTMQMLQNVARRYGLVCLLHEKPFAGINGSGKHNNWSMGTDDGENLMDPGDTPHENLQFLFFCAAVIQAVNKHQGLLRASVASPGQDHRLGRQRGARRRSSRSSSAPSWRRCSQRSSAARSASRRPSRSSASARRCCRRCRCTAATATAPARSRSPATSSSSARSGSSMSLSLPNTVLNTTVAEAIDYLAEELEDALEAGTELEAALRPILQRSYAANKQIVFDGDGYSEEWHAEAASRGLLNLPQTPDALPYLLTDDTVTVFSNYGVLSKRELESRYEVSLEQYVTKINIEAETAAAIAKTMLLPAAARHLALLLSAQLGELASETEAMISTLVDKIKVLERANLAENQPEDALDQAKYIRDTTIPAMDGVREAADALEKVVSDDLWPLPKYSEILFVK